MIEHVEKFCPELQSGAFFDGEVLEYREVTDLVAGAALGVAGYIAKRSRRRVRVSAGIKEGARDAGRGDLPDWLNWNRLGTLPLITYSLLKQEKS